MVELDRRAFAVLTLVLTAALAAPAAAAPPIYPPPTQPTLQPKPKGPFHTLRVGRHARYRTVSAAVRKAKAGDTIKVADGTYREGVIVQGRAKRYLRIVGDPAHPGKVLFQGKGLTGARAQNAVQVNGADEVTVQGFTAEHYKANGFFFVNVDGYLAKDLRAFAVGTYGIYAFNSVGGRMTHDVAAWNNDGGFYIGQTPPQVKPERSMVDHVSAYGNAITGNDIFWNNFDYYAGAPFRVHRHETDATPYPVGVGVLLFGSRDTLLTRNRIFGNYLGGAGMLQQFLLTQEPGAHDLIGNSFTDNAFGLDGTDLNGRDLAYDGNGTGNCFGGNTGVQVIEPADGSTFAACPFTGANAFSPSVQQQVASWALDPNHEKFWIRHPHAPQPGLVPLERYATYTGKKAPK